MAPIAKPHYLDRSKQEWKQKVDLIGDKTIEYSKIKIIETKLTTSSEDL